MTIDEMVDGCLKSGMVKGCATKDTVKEIFKYINKEYALIPREKYEAMQKVFDKITKHGAERKINR